MKEKRIVKQIPNSDTGPGVACNGKLVYIVSQNLRKHKFTLWKKVDEGYEQIAIEDDPMKLYDKVEWF